MKHSDVVYQARAAKADEAFRDHPQVPASRLPPDPEEMNDERAEWAEAALRTFMVQTNVDLEDAMCDLLADMMHLCDRMGWVFDDQLARGRGHYQEETTEEAT